MIIRKVQKIMLMLCGTLLLVPHDLFSVIIITYKKQSGIYQWQTDFSLGSERIDPILDMWDDDFTRQGPFGNIVGKPTGTFEQPDTSYLSIGYDLDYVKYYNETVSKPSNPTDFKPDNFNLESGASFLLSSLPSDFYITTDLYQPDPQIMSQTDYYIDGKIVFPGQRLALASTSFIVKMITKRDFSYGGITDEQSSYGYKVICPAGMRVEFDVTDLGSLSSTSVSSSTKGCMAINLAVKGGK